MERNSFLEEHKSTENSLKSVNKKHEKTYKSIWNKLIVFSFLALISGMPALRLILPTPIVSLAENRELKTMPYTDINNILFGKFNTDFEDYFTDTLPFRDPLIDAGDYVSYLYKIPIGGVDSIVVMDNNIMQGDDNTVDNSEDPFATGDFMPPPEEQPVGVATPAGTYGTDAALQTHTSPERIQEDQESKGIYLMTDTSIYKEVKLKPDKYAKWAQGANRLSAALPDSRVIVMNPPNSFPFYADPKYFKPENDQKAGIIDMYSKLDPNVFSIETYPYQYANKGDYIYFRTDHHWTALGAYLAYKAFCDKMGMNPIALESMQKNTYEKDFLGSNYKQLKSTAKAKIIRKNPDHVDYYVPTAQCKLTMYNIPLKGGRDIPMFRLKAPAGDTNYYRLFLGGDYPSIKIDTDTMNGKSIVVLKDSYANAFAPFLTANYQTIYIVDFRDFNSGGKPRFNLVRFVNDNNINDVLLLMCFEFTNSSSYVNWYLRALP